MIILIIGIVTAMVSGAWIWWASRGLMQQPNPLEGITDSGKHIK